MADDADDVLELGEDLELEDAAQDEPEDADDAGRDDDDADEDVIGFGDDEGAAPASDNEESSTIRDMRRMLRERDRELAALRKRAEPEPIDPGPKPTLADCEFDEDVFEARLDEWKERKAAAARAEREAEDRAKAEREAWVQRVDAYKADKARIKVSGYEVAEREVLDALSEQHAALLMLSDKPAALIVALHRNPDKLADLAKLDLTRAAMMIGKLEDKVTVKKRAAPAPDRPLRGSASIGGGTDKELARLEREAERTGDRTALIRYRKRLSSQAA